jgi:thymidylate synthase (FAD)
MKVINPSFDVLYPTDWEAELKRIEAAGRTCYKSEGKITEDSAHSFVKTLNRLGHHAMLEFGTMTVRFVVDRGISHELVRHRVASFAQESTRYVKYKECVFIKPATFDAWDVQAQIYWDRAMREAESAYCSLIDQGLQPQQARSVLPNSLKTEIVIQANFREWLHIFELRTSGTAHPDMSFIMRQVQKYAGEKCPEIFDRGYVNYGKN